MRCWCCRCSLLQPQPPQGQRGALPALSDRSDRRYGVLCHVDGSRRCVQDNGCYSPCHLLGSLPYSARDPAYAPHCAFVCGKVRHPNHGVHRCRERPPRHGRLPRVHHHRPRQVPLVDDVCLLHSAGQLPAPAHRQGAARCVQERGVRDHCLPRHLQLSLAHGVRGVRVAGPLPGGGAVRHRRCHLQVGAGALFAVQLRRCVRWGGPGGQLTAVRLM
mmetsp:Transcript_33920/g.79447  ORF Transcript_33920/g.79447 Transcript_33920/m.79447 type:complete len:217 (+) Transcript_33920:74-724(+)